MFHLHFILTAQPHSKSRRKHTNNNDNKQLQLKQKINEERKKEAAELVV
jgi:hypothetical protein